MVEQKPSKLTTRVRFPSPAPVPVQMLDASHATNYSPCSSVVEHSLGKGEATCSIHVKGTRIRSKQHRSKFNQTVGRVPEQSNQIIRSSKWQKVNSNGPSRTLTSAPSATSTTVKPP